MEINRKNKLLIGLVVVAAILLGKLFYIQVIDGSYKRSSENNSMVYDWIYPPRGVIYDRNGEILVGNKICYDIMVTPSEVREFDTLALAQSLDVEVDFIREKMAYYHNYRSRIGFQTLVFMKQVPMETYMKFAEEQYYYPGFKAQVRSMREYPFNAGGNLLGYISEVSKDEIANNPDVYKPGDYIGKTGLEKAREADLRGEKGYHIYLRDSRNRTRSAYEDGAFDKDAVPGHDIVTTIDAHLQQYGQQLMTGKVGSVVAIEPSTGEILAMVSSPGIDVDVLPEFSKHYNKLMKNPRKPMFNRTVQASYPPGSVFKLINGLIGMQEGVLKPTDAYPCNHGFPYGNGHNLGCHGHSSPLRLMDAIATSCNGYFCWGLYNMISNRNKYSTKQEAVNIWRDYMVSMGFGYKLGIDLPGEKRGLIPNAEFYDDAFKGHWNGLTIVSIGIGQGEVNLTPLQIANLGATIANRGYYIVPHVVKEIKDQEIDPMYTERHYTKAKRSAYDWVVRGMRAAVTSGTCSSANTAAYAVCGKTGTAQNRGHDHSIFMGFAPMDNPKIAIAVYVENGGFGATYAVPMASVMMEQYLKGGLSEGYESLASTLQHKRIAYDSKNR